MTLLPILCPTCFANNDPTQADAQGFAILFMLGLLVGVFGVLFYTIYSFAKKQRRLAVLAESNA
ncbi:MAG: hypothetical protein KDK99_09810 [Verrucomicrobiales bacterium]|nr:hypothetical protein [Verrucomicrobiales bacterium]